MPHRPGEICEKCQKHIHPQTAAPNSISHPLPPCATCLPPGVILLTCGGCKLTRYCVSLLYCVWEFKKFLVMMLITRERRVKKLIDQLIKHAAKTICEQSYVRGATDQKRRRNIHHSVSGVRIRL